MLEKLDLSLKLSKQDYKTISDPLGMRMFDLQHQCRAVGIPMILLFEGWEAAGKGLILNHLIRHLDPRGYKVQSIEKLSRIDSEGRPFLWSSWIRTPHRGYITIFDRSWYQRVLWDRVERRLPESEVARTMADINSFERWMVDDGCIVLKFWLHISKKTQKARLDRMASNKLESWKVGADDFKRNRMYKKLYAAAEEMFQFSSTTAAPWIPVEAEDKYFARLKVYEHIVRAMETAIDRNRVQIPVTQSLPIDSMQEMRSAEMESRRLLDQIDLTKSLSPEKYRDRLENLQRTLREIHHRMFIEKKAAIVLFEGWDASGKGGAIRRLLEPLDPRGFSVVSVSAPTREEKIHHYLWRFWKEIPRQGSLTVFDRSWYGRVLVERVERLCSIEEWRRAYREINEFEMILDHVGIPIVKFWLHIDMDEQMKRFEARRSSPHKHWKITEEDIRNREKWTWYEMAVSEMIKRTSSTFAPWHLIASNDKLHARIEILEIVVATIHRALSSTMDGKELNSNEQGRRVLS